MRSPDEWWASLSPTRKASYQQWLDDEIGAPVAQVPGQMPLLHVDTPDSEVTR